MGTIFLVSLQLAAWLRVWPEETLVKHPLQVLFPSSVRGKKRNQNLKKDGQKFLLSPTPSTR